MVMSSKNKNGATKEILDLTIEILSLLTGEDYILIKKELSNGEDYSDHNTSDSTEETNSLQHLWENGQKVLELANKIVCLLTGEVPVRCEDVAIYLSQEEWEYLAGHRELYTEHKAMSLLGECKNMSPTGRGCLSLYPHRCTEEERRAGRDFKVEQADLVHTEVIPTDAIKTEAPSEDYPDTAPTCENETQIPTDRLQGAAIGNDFHSSLEAHLPDSPSRHRKMECSSDDTDTPEAKGYTCTDCGKHFTIESDYICHQRTHSPEMFRCSDCHNCFGSLAELVIHQTLYKEQCGKTVLSRGKSPTQQSERQGKGGKGVTQLVTNNGVKPFTCSECGKSFTKRSNLTMHQKIHSGERPFSCSQCGKCFTQSSKLLIHQGTHTEEKPFACSECGKSFSQMGYLLTHKRIHTGEKPFSCPQCGKLFTRKSTLLKHQRIHTGSFPCSYCGKCFSQKSNLMSHQRIHTREKPFACASCDKCFTDKSALIKHERVHTGERPFICTHCGKGFTQITHLTTHLRSHTGEKPFACPDCGRCFAGKPALVKHRRLHAKETALVY